jgi:hypothetical protein
VFLGVFHSQAILNEEVFMERKEIQAILSDDFSEFLKSNDLYNSFLKNELHCEFCGQPINENNIAMVFFKENYKFCCNENDCLEKMRERQ